MRMWICSLSRATIRWMMRKSRRSKSRKGEARSKFTNQSILTISNFRNRNSKKSDLNQPYKAIRHGGMTEQRPEMYTVQLRDVITQKQPKQNKRKSGRNFQNRHKKNDAIKSYIKRVYKKNDAFSKYKKDETHEGLSAQLLRFKRFNNP